MRRWESAPSWSFTFPNSERSFATYPRRQWSAACLVNGSVERQPLVELTSEWSHGGTVGWVGLDLLGAARLHDAGPLVRIAFDPLVQHQRDAGVG